MSDIKIIPLSERPEFAHACAAWSYGEWGCHYPKADLRKSIEGYEKRAKNNNDIPFTYIGLRDDKIIGMVSLVENDHEEHKDLTPWIASVYIHREFRGRGYASAMIQKMHIKAKELGFNHLYLFTPDAMALYQKNGYAITGKVNDPRQLHEFETLMEIDL